MNDRPKSRLAGQHELVLLYLVDHYPLGLTNLTAQLEIGVGRLPSRVSELKALAAPILMEWKKSGGGRRFGYYILSDLAAAKAFLANHGQADA